MTDHNYDLDTLARLSRLALADAERAPLAQQLQGILDLVAALSQVSLPDALENLASLAPTSEGHTRPDVVTETNCRETLMGIAPVTEDGYFLVPRVVE